MKEEDIRKRIVFNKYLKMVEKDVKSLFEFKSLRKINCPACDSSDFVKEFKKIGFEYVSCNKCKTLFLNPRPQFDVLKKFYTESSSTSFWINKFFKPVVEARRKNIFIPRAQFISKKLGARKNLVIGDIGAGFGLFLEELRNILPCNRYIAIEPSNEMADICHKKNLEVFCDCLENINPKNKFDFLTSFELVEHLYNPKEFFKKVYSLLKPGGHFFLTTLNSNGFDILVLWNKSKSISPPHHLNFFNIGSIKHILEKIGFRVVSAQTPGKLDWDIVEGMIKKENIDIDKFWNVLAHQTDDKVKDEFQGWISRNNLSSHMQILAKKP